MRLKVLLASIFAVFLTMDVNGQVVINEIDYDQPGTDDAEFVELFNGGIVSVDLSTYTLELINGTGGGATIDESISLTGSIGAFGYYVICQDVLTVPNCDQESISSFQNGAPDAVGLRDGLLALVDAVSYEGDTGAPYTETTGTSAADNNTDLLVGLSRSPASTDTDNNDADFTLRCSTAGQVNTLQNTGCDTLPVEMGEMRILVEQDQIAILWQTLSEVNTQGFEVQELNAGTYEPRGFVAALGTPSQYRLDLSAREPGEYKFRLRVVNTDGSSDYSEEIEGIVDPQGRLTLSEAYPNPFESTSEIRLTSGVGQRVQVTVYDILGRARASLLNDYLEAGETRSLIIRGDDLPSGLYFYTVESGSTAIMKSVLLTR